MADAGAPIPLCVDLDGTLVRTDMLHETALLLAKTSPASVAALPRWLAGGRARLKHLIAERVTIDPTGLPYCREVIDLIEEARAEARPVLLATAAPAKVAQAIADHLGLFDQVLSSDDRINLSAKRKADVLVEKFGERGFDYIGNARADLPVLGSARRAFLISSSGGLRRAAARVHDEMTFVDAPKSGLRSWIKALRVHQWLKNALVFIPLIAAHRIGEPDAVLRTIVAFVSFSLCASSVYVLNDLLDLPSDRAHHRKRHRPFASGALPVSSGMAAAPLLLVAAVALGLLVSPMFLLVLGLYYLITSIYSFWLKRQVIVDVMLLASLYTIRIVAGSAATAIPLTFWLLAFAMFMFLCLAFVKRYSELALAADSGKMLSGRGYLPTDLPVVLALGVASGMVSVLILAMYTQTGLVVSMYPAAEWLWAPPLLVLYWISRLWMKAQRGEVHDDPVVFAATDWQSLVVLALMGISFLLAVSGWRFW